MIHNVILKLPKKNFLKAYELRVKPGNTRDIMAALVYPATWRKKWRHKNRWNIIWKQTPGRPRY